ncbi:MULTISPECIES: pyridoxamine 5'-phosphate oxidase family protein [unclassified Streptomyces]|uniref:pyridoxamine 5'-phosphate oxidase family protein n=1 Tax=unclassified Streptomyces TaxID=2593676 RepID=UPI0036C5A94B
MGDNGHTRNTGGGADTGRADRAGHLWSAFEAAEPALATTVRERFGQYTHHVLATLRRDGSPRLSGIEADFRAGELWLGMMPRSRKALDLLRDARFSLLANPGSGTGMGGGDVRVSGRAVEITDQDTFRWYAREAGAPPPFHLFRAELTEVVRTRVDGEDLVVTSWTPARGVRTVRRGNGDEPPRPAP